MLNTFEYIYESLRWFPPFFNMSLSYALFAFNAVLYSEGFLTEEMLVLCIITEFCLFFYILQRMAKAREQKYIKEKNIAGIIISKNQGF